MSELKEFDDTIHDEDEYETPLWLMLQLTGKYKIFPLLDIACTPENCRCLKAVRVDALRYDWTYAGKVVDIWCNPPHSKTEEFVKQADRQWQKYNMNIMMIVPANAVCAHFF